MRTANRHILTTGASLALLLVAIPIQAQGIKPATTAGDPPGINREAPVRRAIPTDQPGVHRLVILNGTLPTVQYYSESLYSEELSLLRDLQRAENEAAMADQLMALRGQYITNEQALEAKRRVMQDLLYGYNADVQTTQYYTGAAYAGWNNLFGWGGGFIRALGSASGLDASTVSHTLAQGVGANEGVIKNILATTIATPTIPELHARAQKNLEMTSARVAESPRLMAAIGREVPTVRKVATGRGDMIYLKDGSRIEGKIVKEEGDWIYIDGGKQERIRLSEVTRISRAESDGARKAIDSPQR